MALLTSKQSSPSNYGTITINSTSSYTTGSITVPQSYVLNATNGGTGWTNITTSNNHASLHVTGDSEFEGNVKIKGHDILKVLQGIEKRLAILVPDPDKLEHFEALKKAYDHYKMLEALCELPKEKESK